MASNKALRMFFETESECQKFQTIDDNKKSTQRLSQSPKGGDQTQQPNANKVGKQVVSKASPSQPFSKQILNRNSYVNL